jgi:hypothetical protein
VLDEVPATEIVCRMRCTRHADDIVDLLGA